MTMVWCVSGRKESDHYDQLLAKSGQTAYRRHRVDGLFVSVMMQRVFLHCLSAAVRFIDVDIADMLERGSEIRETIDSLIPIIARFQSRRPDKMAASRYFMEKHAAK
jgi:hypothetical protein